LSLRSTVSPVNVDDTTSTTTAAFMSITTFSGQSYFTCEFAGFKVDTAAGTTTTGT
jgi:hypothetical protein